MRIRTLFLYLIGERRAILELATSRPAVWNGLLFVISAAFAREYDGENLLHEPWHMALPVAASLVTSFILFGITFSRHIWTDTKRPPFLSGYRSFLTLYWMTAPLAWFYAVPYERFLTPVDAVAANLWTLGLVALWRVLLMIRVVSVLMGYTVFTATILVLTFADAVAEAALLLAPLPVVSIMGGIRLTQSEQLIADITCLVKVLGILALPLILLGSLIVWLLARPNWRGFSESLPTDRNPSKGLVSLAVASVAVWGFLLPFTQPEQIRRYRVERLLRSDRVQEALQEMSAHSRDDYPPHWDPPPRIGYGERIPPLAQVMRALDEQTVAPWVAAIYRAKAAENPRSLRQMDRE